MGNRIICFTTILLLLSSCNAFADEAGKSYDYAVMSNEDTRDGKELGRQIEGLIDLVI